MLISRHQFGMTKLDWPFYLAATKKQVELENQD